MKEGLKRIEKAVAIDRPTLGSVGLIDGDLERIGNEMTCFN